MNKSRKKASYGKMKKMRGGDYMEPSKEIEFGGPIRNKRKKAQQSTGPFDADPISGAPKVGGRANTTDPMTGRSAASGDNMRTATKSTVAKSENKTKTEVGARERAQNTPQGTGAGRTGKSGSNAKTDNSGGLKMDPATGRPVGTGRPAQSGKSTTQQTGAGLGTDGGGGKSTAGPQTTKKESESQTKTTEKKSNPYSDAKAKDAKLDDYIKERNRLRDSGKKGSAEYNAVQNKINAAYGKGPTNRPTSGGSSDSSSKTTTGTTPPDRRTPAPDSEKKTETKTENKTETKSDTKSTPSTSANTESSYKPTTKKGARIQKRGMKKADRINKRAFNQDARQLKQKTAETVKDLGLSRKASRKAGKIAKATFKGKDVKAALATKRLGKVVQKDNEKRLKRADVDRARASAKTNVQQARGRKRANMGMMAGIAGNMAANAMQNSKNETVQKIGKGIGMASQFAGAAGGGGGADAPQPAAKNGRYKAKSGFGMLSVKAGIDNNPNPTQADRIAGAKKGKMQDRRKGKRR